MLRRAYKQMRYINLVNANYIQIMVSLLNNDNCHNKTIFNY